MKTIQLRILLIDFAIFIPVAFFIFQLRFGERDYRLLYREMERLVFWVAFVARPLAAVVFGTYRPALLYRNDNKWVLAVILSVTLGSLAMSTAAYIGYLTGWFENFPRSIFVVDWVIILSLSLLARFALRRFMLKPEPASLPA